MITQGTLTKAVPNTSMDLYHSYHKLFFSDARMTYGYLECIADTTDH